MTDLATWKPILQYILTKEIKSYIITSLKQRRVLI